MRRLICGTRLGRDRTQQETGKEVEDEWWRREWLGTEMQRRRSKADKDRKRGDQLAIEGFDNHDREGDAGQKMTH